MMNNLRYELLIRRFTETLIESKEPRREVVTNLDRWRRIGILNDIVQMLYDKLCSIGNEDIADYVKKYSKKKYNINVISNIFEAESKKQISGLSSNPESEVEMHITSDNDEENKSLRKRNRELEDELAKYKSERNNEQICGVFVKIVRRYLKSKQHKTASQREMVKKNINDIISELKMQQFLPADLLKYINDFDDEILPPYNAKTIIMNQHNDHYVGNVGKGGIGIDIRKDD